MVTVKELSQNCGFEVVVLPEAQREIGGVYIGDLLSWVMGRAKADDAWITIMSNINVVAVASLADVSCVILAEGVLLDEETQKAAESKGINVLKTNFPIYETAKILSELI